MLIATGFLMAAAPFAAIVAAVMLVERRDRRRRDAIARQIALTNAIHERFGAIVAPTVEHGFRDRWQIVIPVPISRTDIAPALLALAEQAVPPAARRSPKTFRVIFTPQAEAPARARHAAAA